jgi:hypothetical protein
MTEGDRSGFLIRALNHFGLGPRQSKPTTPRPPDPMILADGALLIPVESPDGWRSRRIEVDDPSHAKTLRAIQDYQRAGTSGWGFGVLFPIDH